MSDDIKCPKCGSTQLHAGKKGFSGKKAVAGAVLTGGIGLLAGTIGSNKIKLTCLKCGHTFKPGDDLDSAATKQATKKEAEKLTPGGCVAIIVVALIVLFAVRSCGGN